MIDDGLTQQALRLQQRILNAPDELDGFVEELETLGDALPSRIDADPENVEQGLAKLVLTLVELLRRVMERQAVRRMEAGSLSDEEIERLGTAFMRLDKRMSELKAIFGLAGEDLNLDLGPLGDLM